MPPNRWHFRLIRDEIPTARHIELHELFSQSSDGLRKLCRLYLFRINSNDKCEVGLGKSAVFYMPVAFIWHCYWLWTTKLSQNVMIQCLPTIFYRVLFFRFLYDHGLNNHNIGLQIFSQKCPLFGVWLISTNFGSLIPNLKSVFGCLVRILQCCQFCVFRAQNQIFENLGIFF